MSKLRIADGLSLPLDAVTQAIGIVAKRRVGKSYTARRFAEQLLNAGQQVVIADPKGDWWGIRSSADGKGPGYPVVILGGEHGDLPLEKGAGEIVAKMVVEERVSVLLDLSHFRKSEVAVFMADFLETLYRLKAKESMRTPLMLIVDEADALFPQKPNPGEERMLGAGEDIVRRGGQRGVGCMMITQRTAVLNKNVLTQCEMLVAMRTISPQDLKAMQAWIDVHGSIEERDTLMASLPSLPQGDAWFWSPGWPTSDGIFKRVHVLPIETFDSGATPKSGERRTEPKTVADVDLNALQRQMAATIEKAKADDPKLLRAEIATLKKQLAAAPSKDRVVEKTVVDERAINRAVAAAVKPYQQKESDLQRELLRATSALRGFVDAFEPVVAVGGASLNVVIPEQHSAPARPPVAASRPHVPTTQRAPRGEPSIGDAVIGKTGAKILAALAFYEGIGKQSVPASTLAAFVGMSASGGSWGARVSELRQAGYVTGSGVLQLTEEGQRVADASSVPTSLTELHDTWRAKLGGKAREMLNVLIDAYPNSVTKEDLAAGVEMEMSGGSFGARLSEIRAPGLLDTSVPRGEVRASDALFPEGLS